MAVRPTSTASALCRLVSAAIVACAAAPSAHAACWPGYSYTGVQSSYRGFGVSASLTLKARSRVTAGHVAAWVGVGGAGLGPAGSDEWVQAGIARDAGGIDTLYY